MNDYHWERSSIAVKAVEEMLTPKEEKIWNNYTLTKHKRIKELRIKNKVS